MYKITGIVIKGDGYGRKLGFPTANLQTKDKLPKSGVYAGYAVLEGKEYKAGIVISPSGRIEAHLIGYSGDAYGEQVKLIIKKFLRKFKKFKTEKALIAQIKKDLEIVAIND